MVDRTVESELRSRSRKTGLGEREKEHTGRSRTPKCQSKIASKERKDGETQVTKTWPNRVPKSQKRRSKGGDRRSGDHSKMLCEQQEGGLLIRTLNCHEHKRRPGEVCTSLKRVEAMKCNLEGNRPRKLGPGEEGREFRAIAGAG